MSGKELRDAIATTLGSEVTALRGASGGDINQAYRCELADGRAIFVKTHPRAPTGVFRREAEGLEWMAEGGARVPEVLAVGDGSPAFLALSWVDSARRVPDFDTQLGEMLARMHGKHAEQFGWPRDNFIGPLVQLNTRCASWVELYGERRLLPQIRQARSQGALTGSEQSDLEKVVARLHELVGPDEPPARLHGDLWSGNVLSDSQGRPLLIDPACYGGHREVDLAMLSLFGRVSPQLLDAYDAIYPRSPGASERVALYQIYPLLVHANLFGGGYGSQAATAARRYL